MFKKNKDILNIALPAMGENFLQMLMGMVDSYLVAHLGLIAISGVSVAGNIITIYQAIFIALGAAISSVISKSLGQKDQSKLAYHVTEALKITLLLSALLGALSLFAGQDRRQDHQAVWLHHRCRGAGQHQGHRLQVLYPRLHHHLHRGYDGAQGQVRADRRDRKARGGDRGSVQHGLHHRRGALQAGGPRVGKDHRRRY